MYILVVTSILVLILVFKTFKLLNHKRASGYYDDIDDELKIMLNEGDSIG